MINMIERRAKIQLDNTSFLTRIQPRLNTLSNWNKSITCTKTLPVSKLNIRQHTSESRYFDNWEDNNFSITLDRTAAVIEIGAPGLIIWRISRWTILRDWSDVITRINASSLFTESFIVDLVECITAFIDLVEKKIAWESTWYRASAACKSHRAPLF